MSNFELAAAAASDVEDLSEILSDWIDETDWMPRIHTREQDRVFVADLIHAGGCRVVRSDRGPRGFVFEKDGHIGALYLASDARGQGAGKAVLDALKADYSRLDLWTFEANKAARRFYSREGFVEVEKTPGNNDEGLPDIRMVWTREVDNG